MKLFNIDWQDFLARLPDWERLSLKARRAFLNVKPTAMVDPEKFDGQAPSMVDAGLLAYAKNKAKVSLSRESAPFARALRAMDRIDILKKCDLPALGLYLAEHFSAEERKSLCPEYRLYYGVESYLVQNAASIGWLNRFLKFSGEDLDRVGQQSMPDWVKFPGSPDRSAILPDAQAVIRRFMQWPEPALMSELPNRFADLSPKALGDAIQMGISQLLLFPAMRKPDLTPLIGLWPPIAKRLHRPKPAPPSVVEPDATFHGAFLMEDMVTVLVAASGEPLRLRGDDRALFAKVQDKLQAALMSLPDWIVAISRFEPHARLQSAISMLAQMGLIDFAGTPGKDYRLEPHPSADAWLGKTAKQRLQSILDYLKPKDPEASRKASARRPTRFGVEGDEDEDYGDDYGSASIAFLPPSLAYSIDRFPVEKLSAEVARAYTSLPTDRFVSLIEFVRWQVETENPLGKLLAASSKPAYDSYWRSYSLTDEEQEKLWGAILSGVLRERLLPLGGLRLGLRGPEQVVAIALTDAGRYLLGAADDFEYGVARESQASVVVQPNFEVVFLSPAPLAEAAVARIAERQAQGLGAIFKITKKSIYGAASVGTSAEQVLEILRLVSAKPVPANVEREIQGWVDQCRRISVRRATIVRCPDAATAARVVAACGKKATFITDTIVELGDAAMKGELVRKLNLAGIFIEHGRLG